MVFAFYSKNNENYVTREFPSMAVHSKKKKKNTFGSTSDLCMYAMSLQLCLTLCNLTNCSPQGSSVHGIFQVRILEWVAISFSNLCVYTYVCCLCVYTYMHTHIYVCCLCVYTYMHTHVLSVCIYIYAHTRVCCLCVCTYMNIHMCVLSVCIYIYTHTHICVLSVCIYLRSTDSEINLKQSGLHGSFQKRST